MELANAKPPCRPGTGLSGKNTQTIFTARAVDRVDRPAPPTLTLARSLWLRRGLGGGPVLGGQYPDEDSRLDSVCRALADRGGRGGRFEKNRE